MLLLSQPSSENTKTEKIISRAFFHFRRFGKTEKTAKKNAFQKTPETSDDLAQKDSPSYK